MEVKFSGLPLGHPEDCRVFIPSLPKGFDISDLKRFGSKLLVLSDKLAVFPDMAEESELTLIGAIRKQLQGGTRLVRPRFCAQLDYVALVGDPIIMATTMFVLGGMVDRVTLLRFDGQARAYWPYTVGFNISDKLAVFPDMAEESELTLIGAIRKQLQGGTRKAK